ncbi:MAG: pyruvate, phosphate dikinase [Prevotellaceae bacterium]|nr:pyruvate, phosphate dikinase [Prevotellaceae bacterium]
MTPHKIDLRKLYRRQKSDRDIFEELMPFKVKEILLIANYYDAYTIEREGQFSEKLIGEYLQLNLYSAPRFTSAANEEEALDLMRKRRFDIVIIVAGLDKETPLETCRHIKEKYPAVHLMMLVSSNADLTYFDKNADLVNSCVERIFMWNGTTRVFLAMAKYLEDKINLKADTKVGDVRVVLLVEDSVKYYSRYLPMLYTEVMTQTQELINDRTLSDELTPILKLRARPKIILVSTYEDAANIINRYHKNLIGVISDVEYPHDGAPDPNAGVNLIRYVKEVDWKIPCLLQSHDAGNHRRATEVQAEFIHKTSDTLALEIQHFIKHRLGFGDFIFRDPSGQPIGKASTIEEFRDMLSVIPVESYVYHANNHMLSTWLMARGEISIAKKVRSHAVDDTRTLEGHRHYIVNLLQTFIRKKMKGRIIPFRKDIVNSNSYVTRIGGGSMGGKGRGLAFLSNFIAHVNLQKLIPDLPVAIPKTTVIGVDEYDSFLEHNDLYQILYTTKNAEKIKQAFLKADLPPKLKTKLRDYLDVMKTPLAVRSSGLFEDSLNQPFAGVYATYIIPNNNADFEQRVAELEKAVKLVYASVYSDTSLAYFNAIDCRVQDEKMAVILQELVGREYRGKFYPNISGVAQSYNFYPFSYMQPGDGFAVIALGLGAYVVGGEKAWRFCPRYPKLQLASIHDQMRDSQRYFYAVDMLKKDHDIGTGGEMATLGKYPLEEIERDGNLRFCASVYDRVNEITTTDLSVRGTRIVDFSAILQYDHIPLAPALDTLLNVFNQAMGSPVEMEFALDLHDAKRPTLYLLQIKPLIRNEYSVDIEEEHIDPARVLLQACKGVGNGKLTHISDVLFVDTAAFDRTKTEEIAGEIKQINEKMTAEGRDYILIGPGRWGTRDKFTGVPVDWSDITRAKVIIEQGLPDFPLDASLGSHFFHNVTSMHVGYFPVPQESATAFIRFDVLAQQALVTQTKHVKHVRFAAPLTVLMDGKKQTMAIVTE